MKRVVSVKLVGGPDADQLLIATVQACNEAARAVSLVARERDIRSGYDLRKVTYGTVKAVVPGAQAAQQVIRKVSAAYATHRANLKAGNYGKPGTARRAKAEATAIRFRDDAAQPYDDRILSWNHDRRTVSIWVIDTGAGAPGRITVSFTGNPDHLALLAQHRKGESDLVIRNGVAYLYATIDQATPEVFDPVGFIGVDLGIVNIATAAKDTGAPVANWSGGAVTATRKRNLRLRAKLQAKGTKSAKRLLRKRAGKEARFTTNTNHVISKRIVVEAKRTTHGVSVENLTGLRARVRHRKPQRATFHSWSFAQLGAFLAYKAEGAGVPFLQVDPAYTSQQCSGCGRTDKASRPNQATYQCTSCGLSLNADTNAAINIARRGATGWAVSHAANDAA